MLRKDYCLNVTFMVIHFDLHVSVKSAKNWMSPPPSGLNPGPTPPPSALIPPVRL